jgi:hypothetical protein
MITVDQAEVVGGFEYLPEPRAGRVLEEWVRGFGGSDCGRCAGGPAALTGMLVLGYAAGNGDQHRLRPGLRGAG